MLPLIGVAVLVLGVACLWERHESDSYAAAVIWGTILVAFGIFCILPSVIPVKDIW